MKIFCLCLAVPLFAGCQKSESTAGPEAATSSPNQGASGGDLVVTGTIALDTLDSRVIGTDVLTVQGQEIAVTDSAGNAVAKSYTSADGTYSVLVPGALAVDLAAGSTALALSSGGLQLQSIATKTGDGSVVGFRQSLVKPDAGRVLSLGKTAYAKITALRGIARLGGTADPTGIVVYVPGTSYQARTDAAGQFFLTFIPPGVYDLRFEKDGYLPVAISNVSVMDGATTALDDTTLKLSGGVASFSVVQLGTPGFSKTRKVRFTISAGDADRFKGGLAGELENMPYGLVPTTFDYEFAADGTYDLHLVFANADGFETKVSRTILVDTVAPDATQIKLADRDSLSTAVTNERAVIAFDPTCNDIDAVAILPVSATEVRDSDFLYECLSTGNDSRVVFSLPASPAIFNYKIAVRDKVGNISATMVAGSISLDTVPPGAPLATLRDQTSGSSDGTDITTVDVAVTDCTDTAFILVSESQLLQPRASQITVPCVVSNTAATYSFANNIAGAKTVLVWGVDSAGNVSSAARVLPIQLDQTPPSSPSFTLADITPTTSGYSNALSLKAVPATCTDTTHVFISETQSTRPGETVSGWQTCSVSGVMVSASASGSRSFYLWARDIGGNISLTSTTASITVDTQNSVAPSVSLFDSTSNSSTDTNSQSVGVTIGSCADADKIIIGESATAPAEIDFSLACQTSGLTYTFSSNTNGTKTVYLWVRDLAGNISAAPTTASITLDTAAPTIAGGFSVADTSSASTSYTNAADIVFSFTACQADTLMIVREAQSSAPSESDSWVTCAASGTYTLTNLAAGTKTIYLWFKDLAGNISPTESHAAIILDQTPPSAPSFTIADADHASSSGYTNNRAIKMTLSSCADVSALLFSESSTPPDQASVTSACTTTADAFDHQFADSEGSKTLYLWVKDAAQNVNSCCTSSSIFYDKTTPSITNTRVTALAQDSITVGWTTSELVPSQLNWNTDNTSYPNSIGPTGSSSSHSRQITGLAAKTAYYFQAVATDYAEHTATPTTGSGTTLKVTSIFHTSNGARYGGAFQSFSIFDRRGLAVCDVNNDGRDDVIAASTFADTGALTDNGVVYVKFGGSSLGTSYAVPADADVKIYGASSNSFLGMSVFCTDYNGDSISDIVAIEYGRYAYIVYGSSSLTTGTIKDLGNSEFSLRLDYGSSMLAAAVGDINGDGVGDVVMCANSSPGCKGFYGSASPDSTSDFSFFVSGTGGYFGTQVSIGTIDGDSSDELLVGDVAFTGEFGTLSSAGTILIKRGGSLSGSITAADWQVMGTSTGMALSSTFVADIDNDGYKDLMIRSKSGGQSPMYVVWGQSSASWTSATPVRLGTSDLRLSSTACGAADGNDGNQFCNGYADARDFDGDGAVDLLLGDTQRSPGGGACLLYGRSRASWIALGPSISVSSSGEICFSGPDSGEWFGNNVRFGNIDGSGKPEMILTNMKGTGASDSGTLNGEAAIIYYTPPQAYDKPLDYIMSGEF